MRLAYCVRAVFPQHGYGGLERAATASIRHLLRRGVDVALYTRAFEPGQPFPVEGGSPGRLSVRAVRYGRLPLRPNGIPARLTNYRWFVEETGRRVEGVARRGLVSAIYAHGLCAWGVREAAEWGVPLVANPHGLEEFKVSDPLKRLAYAPFRAWVRAGCRAADRVVATDYAMRAEVAELLALDPARVVVLPNGVDVSEALGLVTPEAQRSLLERWPRLAAAGDMLRGISVGRLEANKGFDVLLRALAEAKGSLSGDWIWLIVGEGTLAAELRDLAARLGLDEHVHFAGKLTDTELHSAYALCNLFVHPSLYEGSSLVTLEAMAHGLPIVASRIGGIPDKVIGGENGFLVSPGRSGELAERITWLAARPGERERMGARGAELADERFSWSAIAEQTEQLFAELVDTKVTCRAPELKAVDSPC